MNKFKPTYKSQYSKNYMDMYSNDITDKIRCNYKCPYFKACIMYKEELLETDNFIYLNMNDMKDKKCILHQIKLINNNFLRV